MNKVYGVQKLMNKTSLLAFIMFYAVKLLLKYPLTHKQFIQNLYVFFMYVCVFVCEERGGQTDRQTSLLFLHHCTDGRVLFFIMFWFLVFSLLLIHRKIE